MSDGVDFDLTELHKLTADLTAVRGKVRGNIKKAVMVTAMNIKEDWRQGAGVGSGNGFANRYESSIFFDVFDRPDEIGAEIGPETERPGGTAGFLEDAPGDVRAAPQHAGRDALRANDEDFVRGLLIAISDPLEG